MVKSENQKSRLIDKKLPLETQNLDLLKSPHYTLENGADILKSYFNLEKVLGDRKKPHQENKKRHLLTFKITLNMIKTPSSSKS